MTHAIRSTVNDYRQLNAIPALVSVAFVGASLYQFGGISQFTLNWLDYTVTAEHAVFTSLGAYLIAFLSSQTRDFNRYETWEQATIAAGPVLVVLHQYVPEVNTVLTNAGTGALIVAFFVTVASWGVAVR